MQNNYPFWYAPPPGPPQYPWMMPPHSDPPSTPVNLKKMIKMRKKLDEFIAAEIEKKEKGKKDKPEDKKPKAPSFNLLETMALVFMAGWFQSFLVPLLSK